MRRCWSARLNVRQSGALVSLLAVALCLLASPAARAQGQPPPTSEGRVRVSYWEKWTGMEKEAMESVIQDVHRSQSRIVWNEYTLELRNASQRLWLGEATTGEGGTQWHSLMAASVMTTLPIAVLFFVVQRALFQGLSSTQSFEG